MSGKNVADGHGVPLLPPVHSGIVQVVGDCGKAPASDRRRHIKFRAVEDVETFETQSVTLERVKSLVLKSRLAKPIDTVRTWIP